MKKFDEIANNEFLDVDIVEILDTNDDVNNIYSQIYAIPYDVDILMDLFKNNLIKFNKCKFIIRYSTSEDEIYLFKYDSKKKQIILWLPVQIAIDEYNNLAKLVVDFDKQDDKDIFKVNYDEFKYYDLDGNEIPIQNNVMFFKEAVNDIVHMFIILLHALKYIIDYNIDEPIIDRQCVVESEKIVRLVCNNKYIITGNETKNC